MPTFESSIQVARSLQHLAEQVQPPHVIDDLAGRGAIEDHQLIMTSMGNRRRALITPFYPGIQFEANLKYRLETAAMYRRPFVEAALRFSSSRQVASLVLRSSNDTKTTDILESAWIYPLRSAGPIKTTWDVVDAVSANAAHGFAIPARSGVVVTQGRDKNWGISYNVDPEGAADILHDRLKSLPYEHF